MINADTFPALDEIWTEYSEERYAARIRHMTRVEDAWSAVSHGDVTQAEGDAAVVRSREVRADRLEFLGRWYAQNLSDELAAWMAA